MGFFIFKELQFCDQLRIFVSVFATIFATCDHIMNRQTFDIQFYCRPSKTDKKGYAPIELSIVINGERNYLRLQRKERPEDFKKATESKRANAIKGYIESQRVIINKVVEDMAFADIELTAQNLKDCLKKGGVSNFYTLGQLWNDLMFNKTAELSTGDLSGNTLSKYKLCKEALYKANNVNDNTPARDITIQHIINMQNYLRGQGKQQNTIAQYHAKCKAAFSLAFKSGKIKSNPYAAYKIDKGPKKEIVWLTEEELNRIRDKEISIERLENVRDLFVFQCNSGLSYADLKNLNKKDFKRSNLNQIYIEKHRKKTGERYVAIVLHDGVAILEKYEYQLPVLSNQNYNAYLKEIQALCGIGKELHTHLARTTYICYLYNKHIPKETIATIVGHYACTTTLKYYAKMDNQTIFDDMREGGVANKKRTNTIKPDSQAPTLP